MSGGESDEVDQQHIEFVLEQLGRNSRRELDHKFAAITAEMAAVGLLRSGATIKARLAAMKQSAHALIDEAVNRVKLVSADAETFVLIERAVTKHFDHLASRLSFVAPPNRAEGKAAAGIFHKDKTDLMRQLALHGCFFQTGASDRPYGADAKGTDSGRNLTHLSARDLNKWWKDLGSERDSMSQDALLVKARRDFPHNSITRDRIRKLASGRKPGPRPKFGGNPTA